jgi:hypothetical protein
MALVKCWECGKQISTEASVCPGCGAPQRRIPPLIPSRVTTPPKKKKRFFLGCLLALIIPIVLVTLVSLVVGIVETTNNTASPPPTTSSLKTSKAPVSPPSLSSVRKETHLPTGNEAFYAAQDFIEKQLKAPSTARFSKLNWDEKTGWEVLATNRWKAGGFVDAQNAFGAMIRSDWLAVIDWTGSNYYLTYWRLGDQEAGAFPNASSPSTISRQFSSAPVPTGFRNFRWGDSPTDTLKNTASNSDGTAMYELPEGTKSEPLFDIPVSGEAFMFSQGRFFGGNAWLDGRDNFDKMRNELTRRYGEPSFTNPSFFLSKWKWQDGPIEVSIYYDEKFARTTVTFDNNKY